MSKVFELPPNESDNNLVSLELLWIKNQSIISNLN